ncbi:MAG: hypothetical protein WA133_10500 [Syntrophales bacterium]
MTKFKGLYTPREVRYLYSVGSPFIEEVMDTGRLLYMRTATEAWLKDAQDEFESAEILYNNKKNIVPLVITASSALKRF